MTSAQCVRLFTVGTCSPTDWHSSCDYSGARWAKGGRACGTATHDDAQVADGSGIGAPRGRAGHGPGSGVRAELDRAGRRAGPGPVARGGVFRPLGPEAGCPGRRGRRRGLEAAPRVRQVRLSHRARLCHAGRGRRRRAQGAGQRRRRRDDPDGGVWGEEGRPRRRPRRLLPGPLRRVRVPHEHRSRAREGPEARLPAQAHLGAAAARRRRHAGPHRQSARPAEGRQYPGAAAPRPGPVRRRAVGGHPEVHREAGRGGAGGRHRRHPERPPRRPRGRRRGHAAPRGGGQRQLGRSLRQPDDPRRLAQGSVRHPRRTPGGEEGDADPLPCRRRLLRVRTRALLHPGRPRRPAQDHGPARHRGAAQAAGREDPRPGRGSGGGAAGGDDPDGRRQRGHGPPGARAQRDVPPREPRDDGTRRS